ncbi:MAG: GNAT family N-acetyltransferase, partial [Dehalococcoidia bacterium]
MASPLIHPLPPGERESTIAVIRRANAEFAAQLPEDLFASYLASALDLDGRLAAGGDVLVAKRDGRIVGTITYFREANDEGMGPGFPVGTAGIRATAVDPASRGLGLGTALVEACLERARADGRAAIALHTAAFMTAAMALYGRFGFVRRQSLDFSARDFFHYGSAADFTALAFVRPLG